MFWLELKTQLGSQGLPNGRSIRPQSSSSPPAEQQHKSPGKRPADPVISGTLHFQHLPWWHLLFSGTSSDVEEASSFVHQQWDRPNDWLMDLNVNTLRGHFGNFCDEGVQKHYRNAHRWLSRDSAEH